MERNNKGDTFKHEISFSIPVSLFKYDIRVYLYLTDWSVIFIMSHAYMLSADINASF
jgi:hypothetical protein